MSRHPGKSIGRCANHLFVAISPKQAAERCARLFKSTGDLTYYHLQQSWLACYQAATDSAWDRAAAKGIKREEG